METRIIFVEIIFNEKEKRNEENILEVVENNCIPREDELVILSDLKHYRVENVIHNFSTLNKVKIILKQ